MLFPPQHIKIVDVIESHDAEQAKKIMSKCICFTFEKIFPSSKKKVLTMGMGILPHIFPPGTDMGITQWAYLTKQFTGVGKEKAFFKTL